MSETILCPYCLQKLKSADQIVITDKNYELSLKLIEMYMTGDPKKETLQAKLLDLICDKVEAYEKKMFPIRGY